jgi:hypothetical protein
MNMHRPHSRCSPLMAVTMLGLLSAASLSQAEPAGDPAGSGPPAAAAAAPAASTPAATDGAPAPAASTPAATDAAAAPANATAPAAPVVPPAAEATATPKGPATLLVDRRAAGSGAFLDLNVRAFTPPKHGAVEAVVTLEENKDGGREVELGSFTIFPAKKFEAKKPDDERAFRLDATDALADLGTDNAAVKVKVRLAPLHEGKSAHGAKLTLGKVQFVPRDEPKDPNEPN